MDDHSDSNLKRPFLSTSQFKFPRKTNGTSTVPLSSYTTNPKCTNANSNNINSFDPTSHTVPIQITQTYSPNHEIPLSYTKNSHQSDNLKHACLNKIYFFINWVSIIEWMHLFYFYNFDLFSYRSSESNFEVSRK